MDESFRDVIKYLKLPQPSPEDVRQFFTIVIVVVIAIMLFEVARILLKRLKDHRQFIKETAKHELDSQEKSILADVVFTKAKANPVLVFHSIKEFHRLFGQKMHELSRQVEIDDQARHQLERILSIRKKLFGQMPYEFGTVSSTLQLEIGQRISIQFGYRARMLTSSSVVLDVDASALTVSTPREGGEIVVGLGQGQPVKVLFYRDNDGEYQFETHVLHTPTEKNHPFLLLAHSNRLERIQERKFYRAKTNISFKYRRFAWDERLENRYLAAHEQTEKEAEFDGVIQNLSGGGMMFATVSRLAVNDLMVFNLPLTPEVIIPDILGKVLVVQEKETSTFSVHMRFVNIKPSEQDLIVRMIHQRKLQEQGQA